MPYHPLVVLIRVEPSLGPHVPATGAPPDVRRLANLALAHFDGLAQTSRQHSQRSIYLVGYARRALAQTPDGPPDIQAGAGATDGV